MLSTDSLAPEARFDTWRDRYRSLNEVIVAPEQRGTFEAHAEDWPLGELLVSRASAPGRRLVRTAADCARDGFDHWVLRVTRQGPMIARGGETAVRLEARQLYVGTFSQPSSIDYPPGAWVAAIIPRRVLADWGVDLSPAPRLMPRGAGADLLADFLLSLADHLPGTSPTEVPLLTEAFRSMLVSCLATDGDRRPVAPEDLAVRQRAEVERLIRREIASARLDAARLAALAGISRSALYRLYEAEGGVAGRIRQLRLEKVRASLADPDQAARPINEVAEQWGFHCTASFNRAFRRAYGTTPGAVRATAAPSVTMAGSDFVRWLGRN